MAAWVVNQMGGEIPLQDDRLLEDNQATIAWNLDLSAATLNGLPAPEFVHDMSGTVGMLVLRAYRFPGPNPALDPDAWLPLPSPYSSVVRSPLVNDTLHRIYWTNPGEGGFWNTYARILAGLPNYTLGFLPVEPYWIPNAVASGGTPPTTVPYVSRSYLFTYVDEYGLESGPSVPSSVTDGASDGVWTVYGMSNVPPTSFSGGIYSTVVKIRVYRTIVGAQTGGQYYQVAEINIPPGVDPSVGWIDTALDTDIVNNNTLISTSWAPPPAKLDGLIQLSGGMLVGFTGNTIHFCEPNRPHTWPASYDISVNYQIVALGVWQNNLVVLTHGYPSTGSGTMPSNFVLTQIHVAEPCISRGSVITDLLGVYYAGPNGLVMLNYYGMQNTTIALIARRQWQVDYSASTLIACRHRSQYLALNAVGVGFLVDYAEKRLGVVRLNTFREAVAIWNDVYTGDVYIMANQKVYRWDSSNTLPLTWLWRSKRWSLPKPISLGACQITSTDAILVPAPPASGLLDNGDLTLVLPAGVNAIFRIYATDNALIMERELTEVTSIFRLPSGMKSFEWQFEIVARVPILRVELASTMKELSKV